MNIEEIRKKYKSILEEDSPKNMNKNNDNQSNEEQQSEREWINIVRRQKQKRILTESATNKQNYTLSEKQPKKMTPIGKKSSTKLSTEQTIINLKQKLAQSLLNCTRKDAELGEFQHLLLRKNQQIKLNQKTIMELRKIIDQKDTLFFEEKIKQDGLQKQIDSRQNSIQELKIENQLLKKHIQNYANELQSVNSKFAKEQKHFEKIERQREKVDGLKNKIEKLKDDVKRLQFLLSDTQGYAPLMVALEGKHFLGKPFKQTKELQYWYPDTLINGVEKFLKKQQIGYGNKNFTQNLVKYLYGLLERSEKVGEKNVKSKYTSRIKQMQRKKNHILTTYDVHNDTKKVSSMNSRLNASSIRKSAPLNGNSQLKSREFSICLDKSLCLDRQTLSTAKYTTNDDSKVDKRKSFIIEGLEKSVKLNQNNKNHVVMELIESFCKGIIKLLKLDNKTLLQQKVSELCQWLKQSVEDIYQSSNLMNNDQWNQTGKWKTVGNF